MFNGKYSTISANDIEEEINILDNETGDLAILHFDVVNELIDFLEDEGFLVKTITYRKDY